MTTPSTSRVELLAKVSRRSLYFVLGILLVAGATIVAHAVRPGSLLADWAGREPWLLPILIIIVVGIQAPLGRGARPGSPEMKALLEDEYRQHNLARAQRVALTVVLVAQLAIPFAFLGVPTPQALMAMAVTTVVLGAATLIVAFLFFDRE